MFEKWQKLSQTVDPKKAGYSDIRLWPAQLVFYNLVILVGTITNFWIAVPLLTVPAILLAIAVKDFEDKTSTYMYFDHHAHWQALQRNLKLGIDEDLRYYQFQAYSTPSMTRGEYFDVVLKKIGYEKQERKPSTSKFKHSSGHA